MLEKSKFIWNQLDLHLFVNEKENKDRGLANTIFIETCI